MQAAGGVGERGPEAEAVGGECAVPAAAAGMGGGRWAVGGPETGGLRVYGQQRRRVRGRCGRPDARVVDGLAEAEAEAEAKEAAAAACVCAVWTAERASAWAVRATGCKGGGRSGGRGEGGGGGVHVGGASSRGGERMGGAGNSKDGRWAACAWAVCAWAVRAWAVWATERKVVDGLEAEVEAKEVAASCVCAVRTAEAASVRAVRQQDTRVVDGLEAEERVGGVSYRKGGRCGQQQECAVGCVRVRGRSTGRKGGGGSGGRGGGRDGGGGVRARARCGGQ